VSVAAKVGVRHVYDVVADVLAEARPACIFGLIGEDTAPVVAAAADRGITYYGARHENQAIAMADGYARATGRTGCAAISGGPGLTNGLTAITTAHRAGSPILVLVGTGRPEEDDHEPGVIRTTSIVNFAKFYPHARLLAELGVETVKPLDRAAAGPETARAVRLARERTTVLLLGRGLVLEDAPEGDEVPLAPLEPAVPQAPDAGDISALADLLGETWAVRRPLILAGRGALVSGAAPMLKRLGALTGAVLATTLPARMLFQGDPYDIGICGTFSTPVASELITQADCVLAFGAGLNPFTTYFNTLFANALVVQVDTRGAALDRFLDAELTIQADARLVAEALAQALEQRGHSAVGFRTPEHRDAIAAHRPEPHADRSRADLIDPTTLMLELDRILPADKIVCIDAGTFTHFAVETMTVREPRNWMQTLDGGSIGLGLGAGIGAAIARPGPLTVVAAGDGAAMMSIGDLETAVRLRLPILVVVGNDEALGSEVHLLEDLDLDPRVARAPGGPSFEGIAVAMGAMGATVRSVKDLAVVDEWLRARPEVPLVLDCRVDPTIRRSFSFAGPPTPERK
jgi:thiamine pyrophosphate-dependent acetolactate synthase large subunit-like protein